MRTSNILPYKPSSALRRIFLPAAQPTPPTWQPQRVFLPTLFATVSSYHHYRQLQQPQPQPQNRCMHTARRGGPPRVSHGHSYNVGGNGNSGGGGGGGGQGGRPRMTAKLARLPRDHEITTPYVHVRGADGRLSAPQPTRKLLESLDLATFSLRVERMPDEEGKDDDKKNKQQAQRQARQGERGGGMEGNGGLQYPICRIVDKKAEYQAERAKDAREKETARKRGDKAAGTKEKEVEVNWAIAPHDLQTRLRQLRDFLGKGLRVEVRLMSKARQRGQKKRQASREDAEEVLQAVRLAVEAVSGTKEFKKPEGFVGAQMRLFYQGPPPSSSSPAPPKEEQEEEVTHRPVAGAAATTATASTTTTKPANEPAPVSTPVEPSTEPTAPL